MTDTGITIWSDETLNLGEGPLTHHLRNSLVWFDINQRLVCERSFSGDTTKVLSWPVMPSAAGIIDSTSILVATEDDFRTLNLDTGETAIVATFPADDALRANDGRVHPSGAFWIGTMAKDGTRKKGAIWRLFKGKLDLLIPDVLIPNSICFSVDGTFAYYADSGKRTIWRVDTNSETGALNGDPEPFVVFDDSIAGVPDGSVTDANNLLWNARWGGSAIDVYDTSGNRVETISLPARQPTCPAFIGADLDGLVTTTARAGLPPDALDEHAGSVLQINRVVAGKAEPIVRP